MSFFKHHDGTYGCNCLKCILRNFRFSRLKWKEKILSDGMRYEEAYHSVWGIFKSKWYQNYYKNNKLHNTNGPAWILYENNKPIDERYYIYGREYCKKDWKSILDRKE